MQKLLNLIMLHLFILLLFPLLQGDGLKNILVQFMSKNVLPMFSSKSFIVSGLSFRYLIHSEFIFVYGVRECSISFFYVKLSSFPNITY